jgi:polyisoprenoid-binding protein YceI
MKFPFRRFALVLLSALPVAAAPRSLVIDPAHSQIEIAVKSTIDSFIAKLPVYEAVINLDADAPRVVSAVLRFKFADTKTGKETRDHEMNEWQQTEKFPNGTFTLTTLTPAADGRLTAAGSLQLHGVEHALSFPVSITSDQKLFSVDGEATLDTRDFGLPVIRKFALLKVDPHVTVRFHLQGTIAAP